MTVETLLNFAIAIFTLIIMIFLRKRDMIRPYYERNKQLFLVLSILFLSIWTFILKDIVTINNRVFFSISFFGLSFFLIMRFFYSKKISSIIYLLMLVGLGLLFLSKNYYEEIKFTSSLVFFALITGFVASADKKNFKKIKTAKLKKV